MPDIKVFCVTCEKYYTVDSSYAGLDVECPECGRMLTVPNDTISKDETADIERQLRNNFQDNHNISKQNAAKKYLFLNQFKTPILSQIYTGLAIVNIIFAVLVIIIGILNFKEFASYVGISVGLFFAASVFLGIAQVITAVCKTAFYAQLSFELQANQK